MSATEAQRSVRTFKASKAARWLHTYVSLLGFGTLIFFSLTGLTLNHASYFESKEPVELDLSGVLKPASFPAGGRRLTGAESSDSPSMDLALPWVEAVRSECSIHARLDGWSFEDDLLILSFRGPGFAAELEVNRTTGSYSGYSLREGAWAVLNDLHKGRGTGRTWSWAIDISAIVLLVSGVTGLWLLGFLRKVRTAGFLAALVGVVLVAAAALSSTG